ncbi:hypothetical protein M9H77_02550 [Catharanthus roseus]|uniref:Uncharacterized protein n=1 Tax=Catharanthus roseus TaxID=4058 RepID=A0ACC0C8L9_CATRO|nr:hypothetical protein M9H77_02550 [Catharanthus roseus]
MDHNKKIKDNDGKVDNGMVVYMENTFKIKLGGLEDQGKASKLISICTTSKDHPREQIGCSPAPTVADRPLDGNGLEANTLLHLVGSTLPSLVWFGVGFLLLLKRYSATSSRMPWKN